MKKKIYSTPKMDVYIVESEFSIAAASITPHQTDGTINEVWEEETIDLGRHTWE